ncbi:hypothetical protein HAHE_21330 [Haloferula helveola]|uniref:Thiol:disulfide interchange protein DsbD N-terminal domain-containing protein n=1 Tax=Haloferula helveola TaxID=490095 RepID=A0ABM7RFZ2_9BACT|nr:hypothetical protein HAHE_21330 [Haloferula helveola]
MLLALTAAGLTFAHAAEKEEGAKLRLISEMSVVEPGKPFTVGVHIHHFPEFHSYWKSPGVVGYPTTVEWKLPEGFSAGPLEWPIPEKVDMAGHIAHGYTRDVLLTAVITPPAQIAGSEITLDAQIAWMACADACHPGNEAFSLTLPVGADAKPGPKHAKLFEQARASRPQALEGWKASVLSTIDAKLIELKLEPLDDSSPKLPDPYFYSEDGQISSIPPKIEKLPDASLILRFERSKYGPEGVTHLPGLLEFGAEGSRTIRAINPDVPSK